MASFIITSFFMLFTHTAGIPTCNKPTFFGLVPWYQYLNVAPDPNTNACTITNFHPSDPTKSGKGRTDTTSVLDTHSPFLLIGLAILDDLIRVAALVAVGFTIYGGFTYATSQGSPDATAGAKNTIINALIGLTIALVAVGIVTYVGNTLGAIK